MSLNDILGAAHSGLTAAQTALKTVSTNIANVGTPGYARERVTLTTAVVQGRVTGVNVGEPTRVADRFLEDSVYARAGDVGRSDAEATYLDRLTARPARRSLYEELGWTVVEEGVGDLAMTVFVRGARRRQRPAVASR